MMLCCLCKGRSKCHFVSSQPASSDVRLPNRIAGQGFAGQRSATHLRLQHSGCPDLCNLSLLQVR